MNEAEGLGNGVGQSGKKDDKASALTKGFRKLVKEVKASSLATCGSKKQGNDKRDEGKEAESSAALWICALRFHSPALGETKTISRKCKGNLAERPAGRVEKSARLTEGRLGFRPKNKPHRGAPDIRGLGADKTLEWPGKFAKKNSEKRREKTADISEDTKGVSGSDHMTR